MKTNFNITTKKHKYAITSTQIFTSTEWLNKHAIIIHNGIIEQICPLNNLPNNIELIDFKDNIICPAFVDLQLNGCGGVLFNDNISKETLKTMHLTNLKFATTNFLPTLITTTEDNIKQAVTVVKNYINENKINNYLTGGVIGIHIEGPYISKIKKGIHNSNYITTISKEMVDFLTTNAKDLLIKITMAPEENNLEYIKTLANAGIIVSIGHSNASYAQAVDGFNNGMLFATHLFNAMSPLEGRKPGVVGAVLNNDIYCGIIVDGYHVDYNTINLVNKIKNNKMFIVTDAVTPMGTNLNKFILADQEIFVQNGKCVNKDGTLAGANIDMLSSIINTYKYCNITLENALNMASANPILALQKCTKNKFNYLYNQGALFNNYIANIAVIDINNNKTKAVINNLDFIYT